MKQILLILIPITSILFFSCVPEEPNPSNTTNKTRLWRKLFYSNMQDTILNGVEYYKYDSLERLEKNCFGSEICPDTTSSPVYVLYKYNLYNQKVNRMEYGFCIYNGILDWHVVDSISYLYDNNIIIKEARFFPISLDQNYWEINYEYENSLLKKKITYCNGYLQNWVLYEYEDSLCSKETVYKGLTATKIEYYINHFYQDGKRIRSEYFDPDYIFSYEIINYTYNKDGDLVLEECIVNPEWVWPASYVYRYEYERVPK